MCSERPGHGRSLDSVGIRCWYQVAVWLSALAALVFNPQPAGQIDVALKSLYDEFWMEGITWP